MSSFVILVRNHGKWLVKSRGTARLSVASLRTLESNFLQGENPNDDVAKRVPWSSLAGAPLEASSYGVFKEASAVWRSALPESLYVMHLSAYEHSVVARNPWAEAMRRVEAAVGALG